MKSQSQEKKPKEPLFSLGQVVGTPTALDTIKKANKEPIEFLERHMTGDWGDLCAEDKDANQQAILTGDRIFSAYYLSPSTKIWVITEGEPPVTTILTPEGY